MTFTNSDEEDVMEQLKRELIESYRHDQRISAVVAYYNATPLRLITNRFEWLILLIVNEPISEKILFHYMKEDHRVQEIRISVRMLNEWVLQGEDRNIMHWLLQGEILLDRNGELQQFHDELARFSGEWREPKLLREFSLFLTRYLQSKEYVQENHLLDAYSAILQALHHWARILIIEKGMHPEVTVWQQVRKINPGIYKLYEELTLSEETLKQRVELVQLACDFSLISKIERCCGLLLDILGSREEPWHVHELQEKLGYLEMNLPLVLDKLSQKGLVRELAVPLSEDNMSLFEIRYSLSPSRMV